MSSEARPYTENLPLALIRLFREEAAERGVPFVQVVAEHAARSRPLPDWYGSGADLDPDASLHIEEALREHFARLDYH